ncbi:hypothetical protein SNE40_022331 [Patella caerulea]|uniref:Uncharacterized protein n=1 Tax=Patella caerulea TaxID=87958 RepID=A0AAN8G0E3_PATCE
MRHTTSGRFINQHHQLQQTEGVFRVRDVLQNHREEMQPVTQRISRSGDESLISGYLYSSDNRTVAWNLRKKIRVLCWVWCSGRDIQNQTQAIHRTWGRKCDKVLIFTDRHFAKVTTIDLSKAGVAYSTSRYIMAYRYVYKHYKDDADWFFGTFDETYVCMENLRLFLAGKDSKKPAYYGHRLILEDGSVEFVDARVGCILSQAGLELFAQNSLHKTECNQMIPAGEKQLGACFNKTGVILGNSTDSLGRSRFLSFAPSVQMQGSQSHWFLLQDQEGLKKGKESMSVYTITISGMTSFFMYGIEYYLYHVRPFGLFPVDQDLNIPDG